MYFLIAKDEIRKSPNHITVVYHLVKNDEGVLPNFEMDKYLN